ncbi:MAG TPA: polyamine aminopropyltransferase, partial [Zoogloea sp.]|nr:polyamine aminopropyltransferase [Zoogloea sp.]
MKHADLLRLPLGTDAALLLRQRRSSRRAPSRFQSIAVADTQAFGALYCLDGDAMAAEADEFMIHESLVHIPALVHSDPRRALVLGGGDGASARE